jgi:DNA-binding HxlR family transcriptional regulator
MSVTHIEVTRTAPQTLRAIPGSPEVVDCGIRDVLDRIGDKWTLLVCIELTQGVRRFRELQRAVPGISQRMLTLTMRRLERDGMVQRTVFATVPPRVEYSLTPLGRSISGPIRVLAAWAEEHRAEIAAARTKWDATASAEQELE